MNPISKIALSAMVLSLSNFAMAQSENATVKDISSSSASIQIESPMQRPKAARMTPQLSVISSTFDGSDASNAKAITKVSLGATVDIGESNLVTETGILYRQIGASESAIINSKSTDFETNLNYLSIPISSKYYFSNQHESSFFAKLGLAPSILVGNQMIESSPNNNFRKTDPNVFALDLLIGAGGKYQLTESIGIVLEVSYWRSVTPAFSGSNINTSNFVNTIGLNINL